MAPHATPENSVAPRGHTHFPIWAALALGLKHPLETKPQKTLLTPSEMDPLLGETVGKYKVDGILGRGAMGVVYQARHGILGKQVAIKVLKAEFADDSDMAQRLVREGQMVNEIHHPSIVDIFDIGTLPQTGQPYIVMDLLYGEPLDVFLAKQPPMQFGAAGFILEQLLSGLSAAHEAGVIHRDLKPGNIFLEQHPQHGVQVKIIDSGKSRGSINPTSPGSLIGTPAFMAPEQILGEKISPATDLYAVGGIAYQMVTQHLPYEAPSAIEVLQLKMKVDAIPPSHWDASLGTDVDEWILSLLSRDSRYRPRDADGVRRALLRMLEGRPSQKWNQPGGPKIQPTLRRQGVVPNQSWGNAQSSTTQGNDSHDRRTVPHEVPSAQRSHRHPKLPKLTEENHGSTAEKPDDSTLVDASVSEQVSVLDNALQHDLRDSVSSKRQRPLSSKHEPTERIERKAVEAAARKHEAARAAGNNTFLYVAAGCGLVFILACVAFLATH
jgi:serine/threonine protein kinase